MHALQSLNQLKVLLMAIHWIPFIIKQTNEEINIKKKTKTIRLFYSIICNFPWNNFKYKQKTDESIPLCQHLCIKIILPANRWFFKPWVVISHYARMFKFCQGFHFPFHFFPCCITGERENIVCLLMDFPTKNLLCIWLTFWHSKKFNRPPSPFFNPLITESD